MKHRVLLVDDDPLHLESTREFLQSHGYVADTAPSGASAIAQVSQSPYQYSLIVLDHRMAGLSGAETARELGKINPDLYILMFSGDDSRGAVMAATRNGACGFVDKAEGPQVFLSQIATWCRKFEQTHQTLHSPRDIMKNEQTIRSIGLVGRSDALASVADLVLRLRNRNGSVLILGESGTGKELIARALHPPGRGAFKAINCAAFASNPQLMASTLFGQVKGAFTGATHDKKGVLEEAAGGTVFLDEIYALPVPCQLELLRALQEKVITRVGSTRETAVSFRLVSSAKPRLMSMVNAQVFTPDLYYRISQTLINIPELYERREDIEPLIHHYCQKWNSENGETKTFVRRAVPFLESYRWPGNVRELENLVYSLLELSDVPKICPEHLDAKFFKASVSENSDTSDSSPPDLLLRSRLNEVEKQHLTSVLKISPTLRAASRKMGVSLTTVLRLLKKHQIVVPERKFQLPVERTPA